MLGSHGSTLMALLSAALSGPPPARGRSAERQSQQSLAEDSGCGRGADRAVQLSPRPGRSTQVYVARVSAWPRRGPSSPPGRQETEEY